MDGVFLLIDTGSMTVKARGGRCLVGRAASCDVQLASAAISSNHCFFEASDDSLQVFVTDTSTNGTAVNGEKLTKNTRTLLSCDNAMVELAPGKAKSVTLSVSFPLKSTPLKRAKTDIVVGTLDEDDAAEALPNDETKQVLTKPALDDDMKQTMTCAICQSIFHTPVSLIPCMHSFCGGCYGPWKKKSEDCPTCRSRVEAVHVHHQLMSAADAYLNANPEEKRDLDDLKDLDDEFAKLKPLLAKPLQKSYSHSHSYGSDESDGSSDGGNGGFGGFVGGLNPFSAGFGGFGFGGGFAFGNNQNQNAQCRDCNVANPNDAFQCPANNAVHMPCSHCHQLMPNRNLESSKCFGCSRVSCGQYWPNSPCSNFFKKLKDFSCNFHPTLLLGIAHETTILQNYLVSKNIDLNSFCKDVLVNKLENGELNMESFPSATADSYFCNGCAKKCYSELSYDFRKSIPKDELPADVTSHPDCHWGFKCRTAPHNASHAGRFSHVCPQTRNPQ